MELVVVITCVGVLGAVAFPRFMMMEVEARKALVNSLGGAVRASAQLAHIQWIARGRPASIVMDGQTITMLNGYPNEASIDNTLMDYSGFQFKTNPSPSQFRRLDAPQPNNCMVTYAEAPAGGQPAVTSFSSGC